MRAGWTGNVLTAEAEETTATFDRHARLTPPLCVCVLSLLWCCCPPERS